MIKGRRIQSHFYFFVEKSILYGKMAVYQNILFQNLILNILYRSSIFIVTIMSQILINV